MGEPHFACRVRGSSLLSTKRFVLDRGGAPALVEVLAELPPEARARISRPVDQAGWFPFEVWLAFANAADRVLGTGDGSLHRAVGAYTAERDLMPVYARFGGGAAPGFGLGLLEDPMGDIDLLVGFVIEFWRMYYSSGTFELEASEPGRVVTLLRDFDRPADAVCGRVLGFIEEAIRRAGGLEVRATHPQCRVRGADLCRYDLRWAYPETPESS